MVLVFGCTVAMAVFHVLCYVMRKLSNLVVRVMGWEPRQRMEDNHVPRATATRNARTTGRQNRKKQPIEHDERFD